MAAKKADISQRETPSTTNRVSERKLQLEVRELEGRVKYAPFNRVLAAIGGFSFLIVLVVNSQLTRAQREAEARSDDVARRLERMTSVAIEFDRLFAQTLDVATKAELGRNYVVAWHEMLIENADELSKLESESAERNEAIDTTKSSTEIGQLLRMRLDEYKGRVFALADFTTAVTIETQWKSRQESFSPDFVQLFGHDVQTFYPSVSVAAQRLLVERVGLSFDTNVDAMNDFVHAASTFQKEMYEAIHHFSSARPKTLR